MQSHYYLQAALAVVGIIVGIILGGTIAAIPATNVVRNKAAAIDQKCHAATINTATDLALNGVANGKHTITAILAIIDSAISHLLIG